MLLSCISPEFLVMLMYPKNNFLTSRLVCSQAIWLSLLKLSTICTPPEKENDCPGADVTRSLWFTWAIHSNILSTSKGSAYSLMCDTKGQKNAVLIVHHFQSTLQLCCANLLNTTLFIAECLDAAALSSSLLCNCTWATADKSIFYAYQLPNSTCFKVQWG